MHWEAIGVFLEEHNDKQTNETHLYKTWYLLALYITFRLLLYGCVCVYSYTYMYANIYIYIYISISISLSTYMHTLYFLPNKSFSYAQTLILVNLILVKFSFFCLNFLRCGS